MFKSVAVIQKGHHKPVQYFWLNSHEEMILEYDPFQNPTRYGWAGDDGIVINTKTMFPWEDRFIWDI